MPQIEALAKALQPHIDQSLAELPPVRGCRNEPRKFLSADSIAQRGTHGLSIILSATNHLLCHSNPLHLGTASPGFWLVCFFGGT